MKRYITFIGLLVCVATNAQNIDDALRYSMENLQGSARFQGMGGAFGALGGDLSALNINPAGSAVFNNSLLSVSGTGYAHKNTAGYFNSFKETVSHNASINQVGGVFVLKSTTTDSPWRKVSLAINYDVIKNFENKFLISGNSNQGIDGYFSNFAQGVPFGAILLKDGEFLEKAYLDIGASQGFTDQQAFLGYYGGVINPVDETNDDNTTYVKNASYSTVNQKLLRNTSGHNSKFTLNIASQYGDNLFLGASLNFHTVLHDRYDRFTEDGYEPALPISFTTFDNLLHTEGSGFSFSLGAIAKVNKFVRLGGSYQSPTWYRLTDNLSQRINTNLADKDINFINFTTVNVFETYTIKTPGKFTGSLAVIFGKNGLLSFDYGYQDMSQTKLQPSSDSNFAIINDQISNELGAVSSFRLGGEYRIAQFSLRGGYRFEESPYSNGNTISDLNAYSAGIGYSFGGNRIDLALSRTEQDINTQLFDTGLPTPALINAVNTNLSLGYTLNF